MTQRLILVVDDAPDIGVIVRRFGRQTGHIVIVEPNAETAWLHLQDARLPDLAILDQNLPGASGTELCRRLRATPRLAGLRVALFSHWERPREIAAGLDAGADYLLSKDLLLQPAEWQDRLAEILAPPASRLPAVFLTWLDAKPLSPRRLAQQLDQLLRSPPAWQLGSEVVPVLLRRAWQHTCRVPPCGNVLTAPDRCGWLSPDGAGLDPERVAAEASPETVFQFVTALANQIWCLLGTAGSASFWTALLGNPSVASEASTSP